MNLFDLLLGAPLITAVIMTFLGHTRSATKLNIAACVIALIASLDLAYQVLQQGSFTAHGQFFFLDAYNVFLLSLTAFVATTTAIFSGPYMTHEQQIGRMLFEILGQLSQVVRNLLEIGQHYFDLRLLCGYERINPIERFVESSDHFRKIGGPRNRFRTG